MTQVEIKSRTDKDKIYFFSDFDADAIPEGAPRHLTNRFTFDFAALAGDYDRLKRVIEDCAYPELRASFQDGCEAAGRFLHAFGMRTPIYIYEVDLCAYTRDAH